MRTMVQQGEPFRAILPKRVTPINDTIRPCHEARSLTRQEHSEVVQLIDRAESLSRCVLDPDLLLRVEGRHAVLFT